MVPTQNIEYAVDEIERCAPDKRFVQIQLVTMQETPLGRRHWWPLFAAAEKHDLPIGIHPGSSYRQSMTSLGWPSYYVEDYVAYAQAFQSQLGSLICEGAFAKFPKLKVVLMESGVTWLPGFLWRLSKFWRGVRSEVPWVDRPPAEIVRDHVRLTIQPFDAPDDPAITEQMVDHLDSDDILLYASDFPHWQFDGDDAPAAGLAGIAQEEDSGRQSACDLSASQGGRPMNIELRQSDVRSNSKLKIVDVDIHPKSSVEDLKPYLSQRWWDHVTTYGARQRQGYLKGFPYPKMQPHGVAPR